MYLLHVVYGLLDIELSFECLGLPVDDCGVSKATGQRQVSAVTRILD